MKGTIAVTSTEGKGSEFTVQIPITRNADLLKENILPIEFQDIDISTTGKDFSKTSNTISGLPLALIIEDNQDVAHYLQMCLDTKYQTIIAKDGPKGMETAYETIPDIIISDIEIPDINGVDFIKKLITLKEQIIKYPKRCAFATW